MSSEELRRLFQRQDLSELFEGEAESLEQLKLPTFAGGVNPGDQRAVYYLISAIKPRRILEIGTHIACSTVAMALAAKRVAATGEPMPQVTTVDVRDVSSQTEQPWKDAGAVFSPAEMMQKIGAADSVRFVIANSLEWLAETEEQFDFIFLDGDHGATTVYRELPLALARLAPGGFILLHDYFPELKPLWSNGALQAGVRLAVERLQNEGAGFHVLPLGELPWPTKMDSKTTSLALVVSSE